METRTCSVAGCGSGVKAKGLCHTHYTRQRTTGSTEDRRHHPGEPCIKCGRPSTWKGLCRLHYERERKPRGRRGELHEGRICLKCNGPIPPERRGDAIYCSPLCKNRATSVATQRRYHLKSHYGLTESTFAALVEQQNGLCAICATEQPGGRGAWIVDHDHKTGKVRGLLCSECNNGIGKLKDDSRIVAAALAYLTK